MTGAIKKSIFVLAVLFFTFGNAAWAVPRLTLPETVFNFGFCPQNSDVSHKFWLISTGDQPLIITNVIPGCSCTKAPLEKDLLGVGDSTQLDIILSTKTSLGRISKTPTIQTNEGPPDKQLQIIATVVAQPDSTFPLVIQPYKLDVSQKTDKTIDRIEFGIRNVSDEELTIEFVSGADDYFQVEVPKVVKPGELAKGRLILHPKSLGKAFQKSFTIQAGDDVGSRFTIPVKRTIATGIVPASAGK